MGKFKEFLLFEEVGLADIGARIKKAYNDENLHNNIKSYYIDSSWNNTGIGDREKRQTTDIAIPSLVKTGKIVFLQTKRNPIVIRLSDGTECSFSYEEFSKINGTPAIGKTMEVSFQRHPEDSSNQHSKIEKVIVKE